MTLVPYVPLVVVAFYLLASGLFFTGLVSRRPAPVPARWATAVLLVGAVVHAIHIVHQSLVLHVCPVASARFVLSLAALVMVSTYLFHVRGTRRGALGVLVVPFTLALFLASDAVEGRTAVVVGMPRLVLAVHVTVNLLGSGLMLLAAVVGMAYLLESRGLKRRRPSRAVMRLPGLSGLQGWVRLLLRAGLLALTVGVISGAVFSDHEFSGFFRVLRLGLSYLTWLLVGALVVGDRVRGYGGRRLALGAILSGLLTVVVMLLYVLVGRAGGSA